MTSAKYLDDYRIEVVFNNGVVKEIDLATHLTGTVFKPLKDKKVFRQFKVQLNTINWTTELISLLSFYLKSGKRSKTKG